MKAPTPESFAQETQLTTPRPKGRGLPFHRTQPMPQRDTGLTASPRADTASPAAKTLRAAFTSRSCGTPHSGQVHSRTSGGIFGAVYPQSEHRLLDGYQRSMPTSSRPCQSDLYSNCRRNSDQLASAIDLDRQRFLRMFDTAKLSTAITGFSRINRVESLCRKSLMSCLDLGLIKSGSKVVGGGLPRANMWP